jgi:hypothetical protein
LQMLVLRDLDLKFGMGHLVISTTPTQITKLKPNGKQLGSRPLGHYDCHDFVWSKKKKKGRLIHLYFYVHANLQRLIQNCTVLNSSQLINTGFMAWYLVLKNLKSYQSRHCIALECTFVEIGFCRN